MKLLCVEVARSGNCMRNRRVPHRGVGHNIGLQITRQVTGTVWMRPLHAFNVIPGLSIFFVEFGQKSWSSVFSFANNPAILHLRTPLKQLPISISSHITHRSRVYQELKPSSEVYQPSLTPCLVLRLVSNHFQQVSVTTLPGRKSPRPSLFPRCRTDAQEMFLIATLTKSTNSKAVFLEAPIVTLSLHSRDAKDRLDLPLLSRARVGKTQDEAMCSKTHCSTQRSSSSTMSSQGRYFMRRLNYLS
ncbi:hypothetical protein B0T10DRAFT_454654 [Thelonectria olida]|uniref:Uncharacterized protein n=1 Tax=Thelonectria olida TaxID=1576542 RepID=A0A9P8WFX1_9HYPO|nr:hypothetical protein B0T10DRAFT_454654 [Thelonectria olida]